MPEIGDQAVEVGLGARDGGPGAQARDAGESEVTHRRPCRRQPQGQPEVGLEAGEGEARRHDSNHLMGDVFDPYLPPEDPGIGGEGPLPEPLAEDDDRLRRRLLLAGRESAAAAGRGAQDAEQRRGDFGRVQAPRLTAPARAGFTLAVGGSVPEGAAVVAVEPISGLGLIDGIETQAGRHVPQAHQPIGLAVGQGREQHTVDDAEDRGIGADRHRQREHAEGAESRGPRDRAPGQAQDGHARRMRAKRRLPTLRR